MSTGAALAELARAIAADAARASAAVRRRWPEVLARLGALRPYLQRLAAAGHGLGRRAGHLRPGLAAGLRRGWPSLSRRGKWAAALAALFVLVTGAAAGTLVWALHDLPVEAAAGESEPAILLEAANGEPLARRGPFKAPDVPLAGFPPHLIDAVLAIEDRRFYSHSGLDLRGILRALTRNIRAGQIVEGGSTITQQLVKLRYLDRERTLKRKIREAYLAVRLDMREDKDALLAEYLNNVYLGAGATGMPAAARTYFDKEVGELTLAESALLAGLIKAPSQLNPLRDLRAARARAALVLDAMVVSGTLSPAAAEGAKNQPAALAPSRVAAHSGTWFADWAFDEAAEIAGSFRGTMRVRTTLVPPLQAAAEQAVERVLAEAGAASGASQAALVALRPDGAVLAMVGGRDYRESEFNRAVDALRQPGSTFKLFVYYAALRNGFDPGDRVEDAPLEVDGWTPENFGESYRGRVSLAEAFARSLNTATVRLALEVGIGEVVAAARDLGIEAPLAEMPSLALGTSEVSLLDLTGAYASVRAGVAPVEPWGIAGFGPDDETRLFTLGPPVVPERRLGEHHETLVRLLQLVVDRGTGRAAQLDGFAAGKTGTSQNYRDAWFVGFNEALVVGVWVGNDDGTPMDQVTGGELPALIWRDFMVAAAGLAESRRREEPAAPAEAAGEEQAQAEPQQCNVRACARAYRSFRASDCTFQPYRGPRKICDK